MQRLFRSLLRLLCVFAMLPGCAHAQKVITGLLFSATPSPIALPNSGIFLTIKSFAADGSIPSPVTLSIQGAATPFATLYPNAQGLATTTVQYATGPVILEADYAGDGTHLPSSAFSFLYISVGTPPFGDALNLYDIRNPSLVNQPVDIYVTIGLGLSSYATLPITNGLVPYCVAVITQGLGMCQYTWTQIGTYFVDAYVSLPGLDEDRNIRQRVVSATTTDTQLLATPTHLLRGQSTG